MTKSKITINLDNDLMDLLRNLAVADGRSFSGYLRIILRKYLKKEQYKINST